MCVQSLFIQIQGISTASQMLTADQVLLLPVCPAPRLDIMDLKNVAGLSNARKDISQHFSELDLREPKCHYVTFSDKRSLK